MMASAMTDTILIVDDTPMNRKILASMLRQHGYGVIEAEHGQAAIELALREQPALILLDIMMPGMDGQKVCTYLKSLEQTCDIPIIFISAIHDTATKTTCFAMGGVDYITKPFQKNEVLARVQHQVKLRQATQSLLTTNRQLVEKQRRLDEDLQAAAHIQHSLLLKDIPTFEQMQVAWRYIPCQRIGGDIFHVHRLDEDHLGLFMLDVCGHGIAAAMVTVSVSQRLTPQPGGLLKQRLTAPPYYTLTSPAEVLRSLDREYPLERYEKYFTLTYLILNWRKGWLRYSSAAHPPPLLVHANGEVLSLRAGGSLIGLGEVAPFEEETVPLRAGDRLYLYTDGLIDCMNRHGEVFGTARLLEALKTCQTLPVQLACDQLIAQLFRYVDGGSPQDDMSLLALEYQGTATS